jgi:hypothetical protein
MAIGALTNATLLVGGFDITTFTGNVRETPGTSKLFPITTFGSAGFEESRGGVKRGGYGFDGYADYTQTTGISSVFNSSAPGTQYGVQIHVPATPGATIAAGDPAHIGRGLLSRFMARMDINDSARMQMDIGCDTAFAFGKVAAPLASRTTSGLTGTAVAMTGPTASQRLYAALNVTAAAGTNLVVKIQSDDNSGFISATDRITFSTVSATGWQFSSVAGDLSTETYWRAVATIASVTFTFAVAIGVV